MPQFKAGNLLRRHQCRHRSHARRHRRRAVACSPSPRGSGPAGRQPCRFCSSWSCSRRCDPAVIFGRVLGSSLPAPARDRGLVHREVSSGRYWRGARRILHRVDRGSGPGRWMSGGSRWIGWRLEWRWWLERRRRRRLEWWWRRRRRRWRLRGLVDERVTAHQAPLRKPTAPCARRSTIVCSPPSSRPSMPARASTAAKSGSRSKGPCIPRLSGRASRRPTRAKRVFAELDVWDTRTQQRCSCLCADG